MNQDSPPNPDAATRRRRVDDVDLMLEEEDTVLCGSAFNQYETAMNGNLQFNPNSCLRTIDWHRFGTVLPDPESENEPVPSNLTILHQRGHQFLATFDGLLSKKEIDQIRSQDWRPQHFHYNRSDRAIVIDEAFSHLLWHRLKSMITKIEEHVHSVQPLGFGVSGVDWELQKLNPAIRINSYKSGQRFEVHRDAQFAESRTSRSVFSLVIYLTDSCPFGGETRFTIPANNSMLPNSPLTLKEELEFYTENGVAIETVTVRPIQGRCVLFSHDLIHESLPLEVTGGTADDLPAVQKVLLRTDVVAACSDHPMFMTETEVQDYQRSLNLFTKAEDIELQYSNYCWTDVFEYAVPRSVPRFSDELCQEFYEKSMYLRYRYPEALKNLDISAHNSSLKQVFRKLGECTAKVMVYLTVAEKLELTVLCPSVMEHMGTSEKLLNEEAQVFSEKHALEIETEEPTESDIHHLQFRLQTDMDFHEHYEAWCRVATILVLYKTTHAFPSPGGQPWYCARFMPQTGQVLAVPLARLIRDAFLNRKGCGAVFAVGKQPGEGTIQRDFEGSVDRSVMLRDFGVEFTGQNLSEHVSVEVQRADWCINVVTPFLGGSVGGFYSGKKESDWIPPRGRTGPGRRITFSSETRQGRFELASHCNINAVDFSLKEGVESRDDYVFNQCIFDFDRHDMKTRRSTNDAGDIEYFVDFEEIARDVAPFYHAAADHTFVDSLVSTKLYHQHIPTEWRQDDRTIRVKANRLSELEWHVCAEWSVNFHDIVL